jgi:hypothetical protein
MATESGSRFDVAIVGGGPAGLAATLGNVTTHRKAVILAVAAGSRAAHAINAGLSRGLLPVAAATRASA